MSLSNRVAVAVSGGGRTLENLLQQQSRYCYKIAGVIASRPDCRGVQIAWQARLPILIDDFSNPDEYCRNRVYAWLQANEIGVVALAGFLKKFPVDESWAERIINIHPALLPAYGGLGMYGLNVHRAVLAAGDAESGPTVHLVNDEYDQGKLLSQWFVPVLSDDTPEVLAARVFQAECQLYPRTLDALIQGKLPKNNGECVQYAEV